MSLQAAWPWVIGTSRTAHAVNQSLLQTGDWYTCILFYCINMLVKYAFQWTCSSIGDIKWQCKLAWLALEGLHMWKDCTCHKSIYTAKRRMIHLDPLLSTVLNEQACQVVFLLDLVPLNGDIKCHCKAWCCGISSTTVIADVANWSI
jgi:hypothetical protein